MKLENIRVKSATVSIFGVVECRFSTFATCISPFENVCALAYVSLISWGQTADMQNISTVDMCWKHIQCMHLLMHFHSCLNSLSFIHISQDRIMLHVARCLFKCNFIHHVIINIPVIHNLVAIWHICVTDYI